MRYHADIIIPAGKPEDIPAIIGASELQGGNLHLADSDSHIARAQVECAPKARSRALGAIQDAIEDLVTGGLFATACQSDKSAVRALIASGEITPGFAAILQERLDAKPALGDPAKVGFEVLVEGHTNLRNERHRPEDRADHLVLTISQEITELEPDE